MVALLKMPFAPENRSKSDRRMFPRQEMHTAVQARRLDHTLDARQFPRLNLDLRDISAGGLSALSALPLLAGEKIGVSFPGNLRGPAWNAFGKVLRCDASGLGYRVAIEFDSLPAA